MSRILYQDRHFIVANKPAGMLTASDKTGDETFLQFLREWNAKQQQPGKTGYLVPIHFLDRVVSGALIFALSSKAAARLNEQMQKRRIKKQYLAMVEGHFDGSTLALENYLLKDRKENVSSVVPAGTEGAKFCRLTLQRKYQVGDRSLLEVFPETGRSHQIRVQLAAAGLPIAGDRKYGSRSNLNGKIALHSERVSFAHPITKEEVSVEAPLPEFWHDL